MKIENKNNTEKSNNDMENKHKFSDKVKFHPWVGDKYEYGIKGFDENGIIVYGTKEDPGKKEKEGKRAAPRPHLPYPRHGKLPAVYCRKLPYHQRRKYREGSR